MDYYTKHGAGVLADTITRYWADRGHPQVYAERYQDGLGWFVRSNLVNGLPPRK